MLILILTAIAEGLNASAPPQKDWQKCLGGSLQDIPGDIIRLRDGNTILLSNVDSYNGDVTTNHGSTDIWLIKLDVNGDIIWKKSIGGTSIDIGTDVSELPNGNLIISGYSSSSNGDIPTNLGNFDVLLMSTDNVGNILWTKIFGGSQVDLCYSHLLTDDGGFILGGGSYSNNHDVSGNHGDQDFWVFKTDNAGNLLWQQSSGGSGNDVCYSLAKDNTGNIYACGTTNSSDGNINIAHGNYDIWVLKYNSSGTVLWNKTYGGSNYETAQSLLIDSRQNILIGGYTRSVDDDVTSNYGYGDSWVINLDNNGNLLEENNFGGSGGDNLFSILETADGGYLLTSGSTSTDIDITNRYGQEDFWLCKTDASLNIEWSQNYGGSGNDRPVNVIQNQDGGFLVAGYSFSNNFDVSGQHGSADIWLINLTCKVPTALFSTPSNACLGDTITVFNNSILATSGTWYLNNTLNSTDDSTEIRFTSVGIYQLKLTAQTCYYSSDFNQSITVIDCKLPLINFTAASNRICASSEVQFNDVSLNSTSRQWYFPGGTPSTSSIQNPIVTYNQPGIYSVMLTATNVHGSQTAMRLNYMTVYSIPSIPVITVAGNQFISSLANRYQWYFNSSSIPYETSQDYYASTAGYYQIQVTDNNQCSNISEPIYYSSTGINNNISTIDFKIYPNPARDFFSIHLPVNYSGTINIINMNGQKIFERNISGQEMTVAIDVSKFSKGVYKILFINTKGITTQETITIN